jgi:hypothetical protein
LTFADKYPDTGHARGPAGSRAARVYTEAQARAFAELPRCRCGLLLPCDDCLPATAVEFQAQRMYGGSDLVPPDVSGMGTVVMAPRTEWLREHDRRAGYVVPREGRAAPTKTSGWSNMLSREDK